MTYKNHFIAELKSNGQILRIRDGFVTLPFGSEYSLYLKNLNSKKASVTIQIDGEDVLDGNSLIVEPNISIELEGFLKNAIAKNKFKFIKKTQEIIDHRGDKIDDGLIRIEFAFEKEATVIKTIINEHHTYHHDYPWRFRRYPEPYFHDVYYGGTTPNARGMIHDTLTCNQGNGSDVVGANINNIQSYNCNVKDVSELANMSEINELKTPVDDLGITVKGSEINQQFNYASIGETDPTEVIIIQLRGTNVKGTSVKKPIMAQVKLTCSSCGIKSKSSYKFCPNCGTFLE
jgi:hypothetical protein